MPTLAFTPSQAAESFLLGYRVLDVGERDVGGDEVGRSRRRLTILQPWMVADAAGQLEFDLYLVATLLPLGPVVGGWTTAETFASASTALDACVQRCSWCQQQPSTV